MHFTLTTLALIGAAQAIQLELATSTQLAASTESTQGTDFFAKAGTLCMSCTPEQYKATTPLSTYVTNMQIIPGTLDAAWMNENKVEYVPQIFQTTVQLTDGSWCSFRGDPATDKSMNGTPVTTLCTQQMLIDTLKDTQSLFDVPFEWIMGFNEPYNVPTSSTTPYKAQKYILPLDAVEMWRTTIQPVAVEMGYKLVPPTSKSKESAYTSQFLYGCWLKRNEETAPCDLSLIKAFSVHEFTCMATFWEQNYSAGTGLFYTQLISALELLAVDDDGEMDWADYVNTMPIWVSSTSCAHDHGSPNPSSVETCERISGQVQKQKAKWGVGSINWFNANDNIYRWAWYSLSTAKSAHSNNRLTDEDGNVLPPGRAMLNMCRSDTDCNALPID